jgi:hypothetical protein
VSGWVWWGVGARWVRVSGAGWVLVAIVIVRRRAVPRVEGPHHETEQLLEGADVARVRHGDLAWTEQEDSQTVVPISGKRDTI